MTTIAREATPLEQVLACIRAERNRQTFLHGDQSHLPDGTGPDVPWIMVGRAADVEASAKNRVHHRSALGRLTFADILTEEWAEALAEGDPQRLFLEVVQVAATAVQWAEAIIQRPYAAPALNAWADLHSEGGE